MQPIAITKLLIKEGRVLIEPVGTRAAISEQTAFIITDMLKGVIKSGTGWRLANFPFPSAGKTGTTNDSKDIWFIGYTPYYVGAVWIGHDEPTKMTNVAGGLQPALIWKQVMETAHKGLPVKDFSRPSNIIGPIKVCSVSGKLPTELCDHDPRGSKVVTEYFIKGTEPTEYCDVHVQKDICIESNLLTSEFCRNLLLKHEFLYKEKSLLFHLKMAEFHLMHHMRCQRNIVIFIINFMNNILMKNPKMNFLMNKIKICRG